MHKVIGIGSAVFDFQMLIDGFPSEDTKVQADVTNAIAGGPCATALVTMSRLGLESEYMGTIGSDSFGRDILADFRNYNVGAANVRIVEGCQSFHAVVLVNPQNATRTCVWNKGTVPEPDQADIDLSAVRNAKYLYLDGHHSTAAFYAAAEAKKYGVQVVLDAGGVYPGIDDLVAAADILIPSEEFALKYTGCNTAAAAAEELHRRHRPGVLVITRGKKGGVIFDGKTVSEYPAFDVKAVDTNGAGDVFHGAFVAAHDRGLSTYDCCLFASSVSAIKCTGFGARESIPTIEKTLKFLKENGVMVNVNI